MNEEKEEIKKESKSLFQIDADIQSVYRELEENGGELTPELEELLNISKESEEIKLRAYYHVLKRSEADIALLKDERERLSNRSKSVETFSKNLKQRVAGYLELHGNLNKSGTKGLKYIDFSVSTRTTESTDFDALKLFQIASSLWDYKETPYPNTATGKYPKDRLEVLSTIARSSININIPLELIESFINHINLFTLSNDTLEYDYNKLDGSVSINIDKKSAKALAESVNRLELMKNDNMDDEVFVEKTSNQISVISKVCEDLNINITANTTAVFR